LWERVPLTDGAAAGEGLGPQGTVYRVQDAVKAAVDFMVGAAEDPEAFRLQKASSGLIVSDNFV